MHHLKLNCHFGFGGCLVRLLLAEIYFSDNESVILDPTYFEAASKNEQPDIDFGPACICDFIGDRSYGDSGVQDLVSLADYNSRLLILFEEYLYKVNALNLENVTQCFLNHDDEIAQADSLSCLRFGMSYGIAIYDLTVLIVPIYLSLSSWISVLTGRSQIMLVSAFNISVCSIR
jgi:hypothetical protein